MAEISVIVPVYKVEQYLQRCVQSICQQTCRNTEIILVDDGSPDNCGAFCDEYAQKDERIRVIHKVNGGLSSARNAGIEIATGKYIAFVDSDDWLDPTMLELLLHLCVNYRAQIAECSYRNILHDRIQAETTCNGKIIEATPVEAIEGNLDWKYFKPIACNKLYDRKVIGDVRYPEGKLHEDEFTTHKFYLAATKITYADVALYNYDRRREDSITAKFGLRNLDACEAYHEKVHLVCETEALTPIRQKMCNNYCYTLFNQLSKCSEAKLQGKELDDTIRRAQEDYPLLRKYEVSSLYIKCLNMLFSDGLLKCARIWQKEER